MMNRDEQENSMATLLTQPGAAAQWQALVAEAESAAARPLGEELESYLVFLLMRFERTPHMADSVLALDYLRAMLAAGRIKHERLRDVGDQCLLYSGLFPQQAERRRVRIGYFVDLGRSAYQELAARLAGGYADLYALLSQDFVSMMDVLHAVRRLGGARLDPLPAYELWRDTGSRAALQALREATGPTPLAARDDGALH